MQAALLWVDVALVLANYQCTVPSTHPSKLSLLPKAPIQARTTANSSSCAALSGGGGSSLGNTPACSRYRSSLHRELAAPSARLKFSCVYVCVNYYSTLES